MTEHVGQDRTYIEQRGEPRPINDGGYWMVVARHHEKGYPMAWTWVQGGEPPSIDELPPVGPKGQTFEALQSPLPLFKKKA